MLAAGGGAKQVAPHTRNGCQVCVAGARVFVMCYGCTVKGAQTVAEAGVGRESMLLWPWCEIAHTGVERQTLLVGE
jgi:hypothetical protein